jgi:hypothetical protein
MKGNIMPDTLRTTLNATFLTTGDNMSTTAGAPVTAQNGTGMIPYSITGTQPSGGAATAQWVFYPQYQVTAGAPGTAANVHFLPGNALTFASQNTNAATQFYSDGYEQVYPTGHIQYTQFYRQCVVHGSAVEVTIADCGSSGQLVVLPVCTSNTNPALGATGEYGYDYGTSTAEYGNWTSLLNGTSLPDDQPHAKIKLVSSAGGMDRIKIKHKMLTRNLYNVKILADDNANYFINRTTFAPGTFAGIEPTINQWAWYIAFIPVVPVAASGSPTDQVNIQIKITYFVEYTARNELNFLAA